MNQKIFLLTLVTVFGISAVVVAGPLRRLGDFELTDQDLKTHQYLSPKSKITVISVADARGSDQLAPWIQRIYEKYENRIDIDGVADLVTVPKPFRAILRQTFSKQLTRPVMLDWHGTVVKRFASKKHVANIYVVDRQGYIVDISAAPSAMSRCSNFTGRSTVQSPIFLGRSNLKENRGKINRRFLNLPTQTPAIHLLRTPQQFQPR